MFTKLSLAYQILKQNVFPFSDQIDPKSATFSASSIWGENFLPPPPPPDLLSSQLSKSGSNRKANEFLLDLDVDLLDAQHHDFSAVYVQSSVKTMLLEPNKIANNTIADLPSY